MEDLLKEIRAIKRKTMPYEKITAEDFFMVLEAIERLIVNNMSPIGRIAKRIQIGEEGNGKNANNNKA